jgi:hypothetical protein
MLLGRWASYRRISKRSAKAETVLITSCLHILPLCLQLWCTSIQSTCRIITFISPPFPAAVDRQDLPVSRPWTDRQMAVTQNGRFARFCSERGLDLELELKTRCDANQDSVARHAVYGLEVPVHDDKVSANSTKLVNCLLLTTLGCPSDDQNTAQSRIACHHGV